MVSGFALENLFGSYPIEYKIKENLFSLDFEKDNYKLPAHLWKGTIETSKATAYNDKEGEHRLYNNMEKARSFGFLHL